VSLVPESQASAICEKADVANTSQVFLL